MWSEIPGGTIIVNVMPAGKGSPFTVCSQAEARKLKLGKRGRTIRNRLGTSYRLQVIIKGMLNKPGTILIYDQPLVSTEVQGQRHRHACRGSSVCVVGPLPFAHAQGVLKIRVYMGKLWREFRFHYTSSKRAEVLQ